MFDESQIRVKKGLDLDFPLSEFQTEYVYFDKEKSNIVYLNDNIIGFYNVIEIECDQIVTIEYALIKSYRYHNFGKHFLNFIVDKVSKEKQNCKKIVLMIKPNNHASINVAVRNQFQIDYELIEELKDEVTNYIPFYINNKNYRNKKLCLQK